MRARSERRYAEDPLQPLYDAVEGHTGVPVGSFPRFIRTCHGQVVEVRSIDATWVENIYKEVICYGKQTIRWGQRIHPHPIIEWATRKFVLQKLQRVIAINPVQALLDAIPSLSLPETGGAIEFENAILKWIRVKVSEARASRRPELQEGVIAWATMCVDLELYGFGERLLVLLEDRTSTQRGRRDRVTMFDEFEGPYTPEELGRIDDALRNAPEVTSTHRALIGLCRDWGLRPIQIALLTADDVGADHGGPYVQVTSVKGKIRSRMRRNPGNFRKRYVTDLLGRGGRPVSNLGVCTKSDDCTYWPTRSCYGCSLFRPYREANHALALSHLEEDREMIKNQSTGSAASLLDHAIRGAQLIVLAIAEGNVQDGE